ncbi:hypothetical protein ACFWVC_19455 [Streptomyces sp. NPDC058691]|uniref:hypothetical protein n=1 Tax=Streptomyces sp. NPDC058691 TaxID=3346601 RepID=UPI00364D1839
MSEEETARTGPVPPRARDLAAATVAHLLVALVPMVLIGLIIWPLGLRPGGSFLTGLGLCIFVGGVPVAELYRTRPPGRRSAAVAGAVVLLAMTLLGGTAGFWISADDHDAGAALGGLAGIPLGAAAFAWRIRHAARAAAA